ncbi:MAG: hypothetical protein ABJZ69_16870 [Hyphomicrobiales bacterium]
MMNFTFPIASRKLKMLVCTPAARSHPRIVRIPVNNCTSNLETNGGVGASKSVDTAKAKTTGAK